MNERKCTACKITKLIENFYKDASSGGGGYSYICIDCRRDYFRSYRKTEKWKKYHRENQRKYEINNPKKVRAYGFTKRNKKKIIKESCERCGNTQNLEMHHPDYDKPLDVITLCMSCHKNLHKENRVK